jgi:hypothetical protein
LHLLCSLNNELLKTQSNTMKLEHRSQKVASLPHFFYRVGRYGLYAFALIVLSLGIGD